MAKVLDDEREKNTFTIHMISSNPQATKVFQEYPSAKAKNLDIDDKYVPLVEEAVSFNFGDDYGDKLFSDSKRELAMINFDKLFYARGIPPAIMNDDIYTFEDIIHSFFQDN